MPDIYHSFPVNASRENVFNGISTPAGLDQWWTKHATGKVESGAEYELYFSPQYIWKALVCKLAEGAEFELLITEADRDWTGTTVGFKLEVKDGLTWLHFYHLGWQDANEHFRISCYCWAMYLRILKRYLEYGEQVPYELRLEK